MREITVQAIDTMWGFAATKPKFFRCLSTLRKNNGYVCHVYAGGSFSVIGKSLTFCFADAEAANKGKKILTRAGLIPKSTREMRVSPSNITNYTLYELSQEEAIDLFLWRAKTGNIPKPESLTDVEWEDIQGYLRETRGRITELSPKEGCKCGRCNFPLIPARRFCRGCGQAVNWDNNGENTVSGEDVGYQEYRGREITRDDACLAFEELIYKHGFIDHQRPSDISLDTWDGIIAMIHVSLLTIEGGAAEEDGRMCSLCCKEVSRGDRYCSNCGDKLIWEE